MTTTEIPKKSTQLPKNLPDGADEFIEKRLSLRGGSTLAELGADLTNRFWTSKYEAKRDELYASLVSTEALTDGEELSSKALQEKRRKVQREWQEARSSLAKERSEAVKHFTTLTRGYLTKTYGEVTRDGNGVATGFASGELIYENGHCRRTALDSTL